MKYSILFGAIVAATASTATFAEEMDSPLTPITSNNYNNAISTVNQFNNDTALVDVNSVWFNPALVTQHGNQASINLMSSEAASIFFENGEQYLGVQIGRPAGTTTGTDFYDLFWSKGDADNSMGAHVYWSTSSTSDLEKTNIDHATLFSEFPSATPANTIATYQILEGGGSIVTEDPEVVGADIDNGDGTTSTPTTFTVRTFTANIDKNQNSIFKFVVGATGGLYSKSKQIVVNLNLSDSAGSTNSFITDYTNVITQTVRVDRVDDTTNETLSSTTTNTTNSDNDSTIIFEDTQKITNKTMSISADYVQVMSDKLSYIGNGSISLSNNKTVNSKRLDDTIVNIVSENEVHNKDNDFSVTGGAQFTIKPSSRVTFNIQQLVKLNINSGSTETIVEKDQTTIYAIASADEVDAIPATATTPAIPGKAAVDGVLESVTNNPTGTTGITKTGGLEISAPILVSLKMQATNKLNLTASIYANAAALESTKTTSTATENVEDVYETTDETLTNDESSFSTNEDSNVSWGVSYQFNENLVLDFNASTGFLSGGLTNGRVSNQVTMTYRF